MDKEKQIEEMASDEVVISKEEYSDYLTLKNNYTHVKDKAESLQADNERLYKNLGKFKESVSKETAKKILKEFDALQENLSKKIIQLKEPFNRYMNSKEKEGYEKAILSAKSVVTSFKSRLAKQYGVDLGEEDNGH